MPRGERQDTTPRRARTKPYRLSANPRYRPDPTNSEMGRQDLAESEMEIENMEELQSETVQTVPDHASSSSEQETTENSVTTKPFSVWFFLPVIIATIILAYFLKDILNPYSKGVPDNGRETDVLERIGDRGHAVNCGPPEKKMVFSWSPKTLQKSSNQLTVTLDMLATVDLHSGSAHLIVMDKEEPDNPIFQINRSGDCHKLQKLGFRYFNCPVKTNDQVKTYLEITDLSKLPQGEFILTIVITNEKNEMFLCLNADVTVQN